MEYKTHFAWHIWTKKWIIWTFCGSYTPHYTFCPVSITDCAQFIRSMKGIFWAVGGTYVPCFLVIRKMNRIKNLFYNVWLPKFVLHLDTFLYDHFMCDLYWFQNIISNILMLLKHPKNLYIQCLCPISS